MQGDPEPCRHGADNVFEEGGKVLVAMPGVPFETREMFTSEVFPATAREVQD